MNKYLLHLYFRIAISMIDDYLEKLLGRNLSLLGEIAASFNEEKLEHRTDGVVKMLDGEGVNTSRNRKIKYSIRRHFFCES